MLTQRLLLGIITFLPLAACFATLDGFSGGSPATEGGGHDAAAGDAKSTAVDAGTDTTVVETPPCPSTDPNVFLCEDFETSVPPDFGWSQPMTNGLLAVESNLGRRGSRALHARQDGKDETSYGTSSGIQREIDAKLPIGRTITVSFWFIVQSTTNEEAVTLAQIESDGGWTIDLDLFKNLECPGGDSCFSWGNYYQDGDVPYAAAVRPRFGQWQQGEITVSTSAAGHRGSVRVDGSLVRENVLDTKVGDQTAFLTIGALYGKRTTDVVIDDVVARRQ